MTAPTPAVVPPRPLRVFDTRPGASTKAQGRGESLRRAHRDAERLAKALAAIIADPAEENLDLTVEAYRRAQTRLDGSLWELHQLLKGSEVPVPAPTARGGVS